MSGKKTFHIQDHIASYELKLERHLENVVSLSGTINSGKEKKDELSEFEARIQQHGDQILIASPSGIHVGMAVRSESGVWVQLGEKTAFFERSSGVHEDGSKDFPATEIHAPMTGKIIKVNASAGDQVNEGEILVIMEAMKMEFKLEAPLTAEVEQILCEVGELVDLGQLLVQLKPPDHEARS